jgi:hypothetical protein
VIQLSRQRQQHVIAVGGAWHKGQRKTPAQARVGGQRHAAVTAGAHHGQVLTIGPHSGPHRTGVLLLRIWLEGGRDDPQLRIRIVGRQDLAEDAQDDASASTVEEALVLVSDWLQRFAALDP